MQRTYGRIYVIIYAAYGRIYVIIYATYGRICASYIYGVLTEEYV